MFPYWLRTRNNWRYVWQKKCEVGFLPSKTRNNLPRFQAPERDAFITWPVNTGNWGSTLWDSNNPIGSSVWGKNATCQKLVLGLHPRLPKRSLVKSDPIQSQKETVIYVAAKILPSLVSGLWNCPWWRIVINQPAGTVGWDSFFCGWKIGGTWWGGGLRHFWCDSNGKAWIRAMVSTSVDFSRTKMHMMTANTGN